DHVGVFAQEEQCKAHARILDHVTSHNFRFAFNHVKWVTCSFSHRRNHVDHEQRQQRQPVPGHEVDALVGKPAVSLAQHDTADVQRARYQQDCYQHKADGQLVRHHLSRCTQCTQESVLGVGCPTGNDDAIYTNGRNCHDVEQTSVDIGQYHFRTEWNHSPG